MYIIQGESKKTDTFDIQMNNKGVSFFWLTLYNPIECFLQPKIDRIYISFLVLTNFICAVVLSCDKPRMFNMCINLCRLLNKF
jgi:hypothetical protein